MSIRLSSILVLLAIAAQPVAALNAVDLPACNVRVEFSGTPRTLSAAELSAQTNGASTRAGVSAVGLGYQSSEVGETAVCTCGQHDLAEDWFVAEVDAARRKNGGRGSSERLRGIGRAYDIEIGSPPAGVLARNRVLSLEMRPACLLELKLIQSIAAAPSTFLSRVFVIQPGESNSTGEVANRLRRLDELLRDKLISQAEYEQARKKIIENL